MTGDLLLQADLRDVVASFFDTVYATTSITAAKIYTAANVEHEGDSNTKMRMTTDNLYIEAGGLKIIHGIEANTDKILFGDADWDYMVFGDTTNAEAEISSYTYLTKLWSLRNLDVVYGIKGSTFYFTSNGEIDGDLTVDGGDVRVNGTSAEIIIATYGACGIRAINDTDLLDFSGGGDYTSGAVMTLIGDARSASAGTMKLTSGGDGADTNADILFQYRDTGGTANIGKIKSTGEWNVGLDAYKSTFTATGDWKFPADIIISSRPRAYFAYFLEGSSVHVNTAGQWDVLMGTGTLVEDAGETAWFNAEADANGNNNRITYVGANTHQMQIIADGSFVDTEGGAAILHFRVTKNGTVIPLAEEDATSANVGSDDMEVALVCHTSMATDDYIELEYKTDGDDPAVDHVQVSIVPID
jgi:hypothetical protein